ncbi:MAG: MFS transporter, partial [Oscillospiraceae bacterium]|nr:MFS transporter [Oscillospiraceae bacterium]
MFSKKFLSDCRDLLILWSTQSLSQLGSSMTGFALVLWSYSRYGSALTTALLTVCSYAPYVVMSVFAGA